MNQEFYRVQNTSHHIFFNFTPNHKLMSSTISSSEIQNNWDGGSKPLDASYGKLMMWFFIVSDALTFTGFLVAYGFSRFKNIVKTIL